MVSLFKRKSEVRTGEYLQIKTHGYPQIVKDIHNEFNLAGERSLKEAKEILASIRIDNGDKVTNLKKFGFGQVKEIKETEEQLKLRKSNDELASTLEMLSVKYPAYKFITHQVAIDICKKYNLVLGDVGQFTGFVPEKNLNQISAFFEKETELNTICGRSYVIRLSGGESISEMTFAEYEKETQLERYVYENKNTSSHDDFMLQMQRQLMQSQRSQLIKRKRELKIAAPLKDMKTDGYTLKDRIFTKEIPDPVVLAPIKFNNTDLYCIVTAWGDEASDPMVINEIQN